MKIFKYKLANTGKNYFLFSILMVGMFIIMNGVGYRVGIDGKVIEFANLSREKGVFIRKTTMGDYADDHMVTVTAYNAVPSQTDGDPKISACGPTRAGQIAVSQDLRQKFPCGSIVELYRPDTKRWHQYIVNDTMHKRKTNQVDILMARYSDAMQHGIQYGGKLRIKR